MMRRFLTFSILFVCFVTFAMGCRSQAPSPPAADTGAHAVNTQASKGRALHVGTWTSTFTEQHKLTEELLRPPEPENNDHPTIIFDGVGHWADTNFPIANSAQMSKANDQLTPDEAKEIVFGRNGHALFGTHTLNVPHRYTANHLLGNIDPRDTGTDRIRFVEVSDKRLSLEILPQRGFGEIDWRVWERVPVLEHLTSTHRRLIGFWKLVSFERRKAGGQLLSSTPIEAGYIIYTSSGIMAFHLVQPNRKQWAAREPTPAEAKAALITYTAYRVPYTIDEAKGLVTHQGIGALSHQGGSDAQYSYEISGNRLILTSPPAMADGEARTIITGERISGDDPSNQP